MRLLTHNMLVSNVPSVKEEDGYPLGLEVTEKRDDPVEFDADDVRLALKRHVKYDALVMAAKACDVELPEAYDEACDEATLRKIHYALNEIHIVEGELICPASGRRYKITNGIPNMPSRARRRRHS
mmetsp:Transcript_3319/g.9771  ORF Transcript_3319/g.9771 Transcript_3319/m.9771 type:complete len:126 (+) Transcript_3319:110-487(+)